MTSWFEQFLDEDKIVLRDKYNRTRLVRQRKWAVMFFLSAYLLESDYIRVWGTFGPIDFTRLPEVWIANALLAGCILVALFSLIQLPTFLLNYPQFLRESFAELRAKEREIDAVLRQNLLSEKQSEEKTLASYREDVTRYQNWLFDLQHLDRIPKLMGSAEASKHDALRSEIREKLNLSLGQSIPEVVQNQLEMSKTAIQGLEKNIASIESQIQGISSVDVHSRSFRFQYYSITEALTDALRIAPTFLLGALAISRVSQ